MYQTNYLKIYSTDFRQIFKVGKTVTVDDQFEISFWSLKGRCHSNQFLLVLHTQLGSGDIRQMALAYGKSGSLRVSLDAGG